MVLELIRKLYTMFRQLAGTGTVLVLFIAAALAMVLYYSKRSKGSIGALLSPVGIIGVIMASVLYDVASDNRGRRWLRNAAVVFTACLCICAITSQGTSVFSGELSETAENELHIPSYLLDVMSKIVKDTDNPCVLVMPGWGPYFESYSSRFVMAYPEPQGDDLSAFDEDERIMYTQLCRTYPDMKSLAAAAHRKGCSYVVLSKDMWPDVPITRFGYEQMLENDKCMVYREVTVP